MQIPIPYSGLYMPEATLTEIPEKGQQQCDKKDGTAVVTVEAFISILSAMPPRFAAHAAPIRIPKNRLISILDTESTSVHGSLCAIRLHTFGEPA